MSTDNRRRNDHNNEKNCSKLKVLTFDGFYASKATSDMMMKHKESSDTDKTFFCCGTRRPEAMRSIMAENHLSEELLERDRDSILFHDGLYNASNGRTLSAISVSNSVFCVGSCSS